MPLRFVGATDASKWTSLGPLALDGAFAWARGSRLCSTMAISMTSMRTREKRSSAALEYDFSASATLTAGLSYQWDEASAVITGLPFYADGRDSHLPRDTALAPDWARYRSDLGGIYLQYRHQLAPDWGLKLNASGWRTEVEFELGRFRCTNRSSHEQLNSRLACKRIHCPPQCAYATAPLTSRRLARWSWFGWREEVAIGADFTRSSSRSRFQPLYSDHWLGDPRAFDPSAYPDPRAHG